MNEKLKEKESSQRAKKNQHLTNKQKLMFGLVCWGIQSWGQSESFKTNGYNRKYIDSRKAMYTGLVIYGIGITLFVLTVIF